MEDEKPQTMTFNKGDALAGMPDEMKDAVVGPMIGISAIALNMALKYADINTVQDGVLYQQYKMEGKNMQGLHLAYVFDIAMQIEEHLVKANKRVAQLLVASALAEDIEEVPAGDDAPEDGPSTSTLSP